MRVPDDADIDTWLRSTTDHHGYERAVLTGPDSDETPPSPIGDLLATAHEAGFEWDWEPDRRLLSDGDADLQVNYGLDEWFTSLATALRAAGWGYHFESAGKYELPGECWEWMPGWPTERTFVQSGESKALDAAGLRAALDEADQLGLDPAEHLTGTLTPWSGWTAPTT
ncbi:MAG: hypothetical protein AB7H43_15140 [Acidimicrobiia bacterium]